MAVSKKNKQVKQKEIPRGKSIAQGGNPEQYYIENPAWSFANSDQDMWSFTQEHIGGIRSGALPICSQTAFRLALGAHSIIRLSRTCSTTKQ